jgi:hypothetical protein
MAKEKNYYKDRFEEPSFLNKETLKQQEEKITSGEIKCNTDAPEECESCSG